MPVFIYQPDAFDLMCKAEEADQRWHDSILAGEFRNAGFPAFLEAWRRWEAATTPEYRASCRVRHTGRVHVDSFNVTIYGLGGYHRYLVEADGELVVIAAMCMSQEALDQVRSVGFSSDGDEPYPGFRWKI